MAADTDLGQTRELTSKLFQSVSRAQEDFVAIAEEFGLTALQARTLLWLHVPRAMGEVADHLECDASNVTGLADRLQRRGMIERVPGEDRRVKLLSLTDRGKKTRAELARRVATGATVAARLTKSEQVQLSALLDKLID